MMHVLFLTQGRQAPSSRYRVEQLLPHLRQRGIRCDVRPAYGEFYNRVVGTAVAVPYKLACRLRGTLNVFSAAAYDVVVVQKQLLPHTSIAERLLAKRNPRLVFDFDDAIYLGANGRRSFLRERAFRGAVEAAAWVVAGNKHLAAVAAAPMKTTVIPTTVDTEIYSPGARTGDAPVTVGWMGTSGNFRYLEAVLPSILKAVERTGARFRLVSNGELSGIREHPNVEQIRWSADREVELLQSFDIGLMPLSDSPQARGKCGFKILQYMAVGCPVVASAVGANVDILRGSDAGFLLPSGVHDWREPLERLIHDADLRNRLGSAGRAHCVASYSVVSAVDRYLEIFDRLAQS